MGRAPCCDKNKVKRGPWSPEEDSTLKDYVLKHGTGGNWIALPKKAGLKRCGKSCRLRWLNYLRPDIKHGGFTEEEDNLIISIYSNIGSRWSVIASQLPGRTDNDIKNYWNTKLKKRVLSAAKATTSIYAQNPPDFPTILTPPDTIIATSSAAPPPPLQDVAGEIYGILPTQPYLQATNATTLTYPDVHGMPEIFVPEIPYEFNHYQDFPLPRLMEFQENIPSNYDSSSQEILCLSSNSCNLFYSMSYANYASWNDDNGVAEEAGFLMEMGSKSSCDALQEFEDLSRLAGI